MILNGKRAAYITLGCKLNFSETSTIRRSLEDEGVISVNEDNSADIYIINTCSVTDTAERKGRQLIRKIIKHHPAACIVVIGCYAQLRAKELLEIEGVDMVLGTMDKFKVAHYLKHDTSPSLPPPHSCDIFKLSTFDLACSFGDRTRCFLKIQDGCDYFCTYCTIPYARGSSRSATIPEVINAAKEAAAKGIAEIILTGVNTGDFGKGREDDLLTLMKELDQLEEIRRFRISSIEPNLLTNEIIAFVASSRKFMPHFHIPLQSGSNNVLKLMKRRYTTELFAEKIDRIRTLCPDAFIGVDIIAGMRGETAVYFKESEKFIENLDVSQLHVFPYSERKGTKALEIEGVVSQEEKRRRVSALLTISEQKLRRFYERFEGQTRNVLFEDSKIKGNIAGFTDNYIRVALAYKQEFTNKIIPILLKKEHLIFE